MGDKHKGEVKTEIYISNMVAFILQMRTFFRSYTIPIIASILLILLVVILVMVHQYNLSRVGDLAKANPLISSESEKLVSQDQATSPAIDPSGDDVTIDPTVPTAQNSANTGSGTATSSGSSTASSDNSGQHSGSSSSTSSQPGDSSAPMTPAMSASIGTIVGSVTKNCLLIICTTDYTFTGVINVANGPGVVQYRWERSNGDVGATEQKTASSGSSSFTVSHTWTGVSSGWVKLRILAPNQTEKQYSFGS